MSWRNYLPKHYRCKPCGKVTYFEESVVACEHCGVDFMKSDLFPGDRYAVEELRQRMQARLGREIDLPELSERPVLCSLVYERKGQITNAVFLEVECEVQALGDEPLPRLAWDKAGKMLSEACALYDIRLVRAFVPNEALESRRKGKLSPIEKILRYFSFTREDSARFTAFSRWMGRD